MMTTTMMRAARVVLLWSLFQGPLGGGNMIWCAHGSDNIAVGVLVNDGHNDNGACSDADAHTLDTSLRNALTISTAESAYNSSIRGRRQLNPSYCQACCRGFAPGTCFLVYRACTNYRRRALAENAVQSEAATAVALFDANAQEAGLPEIQEMRKIPPGKHRRMCRKAKRALMDTVKKDLEGDLLSSPCQRQLKKKYNFICLLIPDE